MNSPSTESDLSSRLRRIADVATFWDVDDNLLNAAANEVERIADLCAQMHDRLAGLNQVMQ